MKKLLTLVSFLLLLSNSFAQFKHYGWSSNNIFQTDYFIENHGQFDTNKPKDESILYGVDNHGDHIYFTPSGFIWQLMIKRDSKKKENENAKADEKENEKIKIDTCRLQLKWLNTNEHAQIIQGEKSKHYFSFGDAQYVSYGYKTITYSNLYPGIDIVYSIANNGGIEYKLILKHGADLSAVKFIYTADKKIHLSLSNNELKIDNSILPMSEKNIHAFDSHGNEIQINYVLNGNEISFVAINYDNEGLIIDPWITAITTLTGPWNNEGCDVDYDVLGNLYVMGGGGSAALPDLPKLAKYDLNGVLLWTFTGEVVTPFWQTCGGADYISNFVVDKSSGKTYLGQPWMGTGTQVIRLNAAGIYDNYISNANSNFEEIWEMKFNCLSGELLGMGGGTSSNINMGIIDTSSGSVSNLNVTGFGGTDQDIVSCAINDLGQPFIVFAGGSADNVIYKLNNNYSTSIWNQPDGYSNLSELSNKSFLGGGYGSNGFNCLAVNASYLFYYDGFNLKAFNQTTGAPVGTPITIAGYQPLFQGGIYANSCDEIFLGGKIGNILKYHFNGSTFTALPALTIAGYPTAYISDIVFNPLNSLLYVCGEGFVATVDPQTLCVDSISSIQLQLTTVCPDSAIVTITNPVGSASYSFIWRDSLGNIISSNIAPAGVSTNGLGGLAGQTQYSVQVLQTSACQVVSSTINFTLICNGVYVSICDGQSYLLPGGITVTTPGIYTDTIPSSQPGIDSIIVTNLSFYPFDSTNVYVSICHGQSYTLPSGQIVNQSGIYVDTFTDVHGCDSICALHLTVLPNVSTIQASICNGNNYQLPGGAVVSTAGTYHATLITALGCDSVITINLTVFNPSSSAQNKTICNGVIFQLPDGLFVTQAGTYTSVILNSHLCDSTITTVIKTVPFPTVNLGNDTSFCDGQILQLNATNPQSTYWWNNGSTDSSIIVHDFGIYSVIVSAPPCPDVKDSINIISGSCSCIIMPDAFSPNGDGRNDAIKPIMYCGFTMTPYEYCIYNRWGQLIFKTNDINERWDGTYKNVNQEVDVYVYTISYFNPFVERTILLKGNISLIR